MSPKQSGTLTVCNRPPARVSRRVAIGLIACSPLLLYSQGSFTPLANAEDQLRRDLADMQLPFQPAKLDLVQFAMLQEPDGVQMDAVVRMMWPPGMRQFRFMAQATDPTQVYSLLIQDVWLRFSAAS